MLTILPSREIVSNRDYTIYMSLLSFVLVELTFVSCQTLYRQRVGQEGKIRLYHVIVLSKINTVLVTKMKFIQYLGINYTLRIQVTTQK